MNILMWLVLSGLVTLFLVNRVCHWRGLPIQEFYKCYKERGLLPEFILYVVIWPISMSVLLTALAFLNIDSLFK